MILTTMLDDTIVKKFSFILKCLWRIVIINKVRMQLSWKVDLFIHSINQYWCNSSFGIGWNLH